MRRRRGPQKVHGAVGFPPVGRRVNRVRRRRSAGRLLCRIGQQLHQDLPDCGVSIRRHRVRCKRRHVYLTLHRASNMKRTVQRASTSQEDFLLTAAPCPARSFVEDLLGRQRTVTLRLYMHYWAPGSSATEEHGAAVVAGARFVLPACELRLGAKASL